MPATESVIIPNKEGLNRWDTCHTIPAEDDLGEFMDTLCEWKMSGHGSVGSDHPDYADFGNHRSIYSVTHHHACPRYDL